MTIVTTLRHSFFTNFVDIPSKSPDASASYLFFPERNERRSKKQIPQANPVVLFCMSPESIKCGLLKCMCQRVRAFNKVLLTSSSYGFSLACSLFDVLGEKRFNRHFCRFHAFLSVSLCVYCFFCRRLCTWGFIRWQTYDIFVKKINFIFSGCNLIRMQRITQRTTA